MIGLDPPQTGAADPESPPQRYLQTAGAYLSPRWLALGLLALSLGYAFYGAATHRGQDRQGVLLIDAAACVIFAALTIALFRIRVPARWSDSLAAAMVLVTSANILLSAYIRQSFIELAYAPFMLVVSGSLVLSAIWLTVIGSVVVGGAVPIALHVLPGEFIVDYYVTLAASVALMVIVFVNRVKAQQHVQRLREADLRLAASLREALERSELRLREQQQTERRRQELEDQLRQAQKLEAVGVLAGGVAHDMNNVLGAITSIASLASNRASSDPLLMQDIDDILSAARRGSALTRNLLGFARQGTRIKERFRMEGTVESIVHLLRRTVSKQVELRVDTQADLDDIVGDQGQLSHVLMNLCINAVDATQGRGTILIRATNLWADSELALLRDIPVGRYIELTVEDNGCGIPPDVLPRVFEPFFSTKSSNERSGLGLSMVYGTVRDHGGAVVIESTVGVGTKIHVMIPSQLKTPASIAPPAIRAVRPTEARRIILLVDDEPLLRSAGRRIISSLGFEPVVAANGAEAIAVFRRLNDDIALVVLDVAMPVMGGADCFRRLREIDADVPVLVASGYAKHGDVDELLAAGATGYLSKPYDCDQMSSAIHRCLSLSQTIAIAKGMLPNSGNQTNTVAR